MGCQSDRGTRIEEYIHISKDYILVAAEISTAWWSWEMMPQCYGEKDGKCSSPPFCFTFLENEKGLLIRLFFVFLGIQRVLSLKMFLWPKYKANL